MCKITHILPQALKQIQMYTEMCTRNINSSLERVRRLESLQKFRITCAYEGFGD